MPYETDFDTAFTLLLGKAVAAEQAIVGTGGSGTGSGTGSTTPSLPASIAFEFAGGGYPLSTQTASPVFVEIPFTSRLVWVHIYAGDAQGRPMVMTSASFEIYVTRYNSGGVLPLYGNGAKPTMSGAASANIDLTGWAINLDVGDALVCYPTALSGNASFIVMSMQIQPAVGPVGITVVTDNTGATVTSNTGAPTTSRLGPS